MSDLGKVGIVILCIINIGFSLYYVLESTRLEKIFSLEDHHIGFAYVFHKENGIWLEQTQINPSNGEIDFTHDQELVIRYHTSRT